MAAINGAIELRSQVIELFSQLKFFPRYLILLGNQNSAFVGDLVPDNGSRNQQSVTPQLYQALIGKLANCKDVVEGEFSGKSLGREMLTRALWLLVVDETADSLVEEAENLYDFVVKFSETTKTFSVVGETGSGVTGGVECYSLVVNDKQLIFADMDEEDWQENPSENMSLRMFNILWHYPAAKSESDEPNNLYKIIRVQDMLLALEDLLDPEDAVI
jgi:hypothetical protein